MLSWSEWGEEAGGESLALISPFLMIFKMLIVIYLTT